MAKQNWFRLGAVSGGRPHELMFSVVAGAAADTNIAVTGIRRTSGLVAVLEFQPPTAGSGNAIVADRVAITSVTSDGNIQVAGQSTAGNQLLVIWLKKRT